MSFLLRFRGLNRESESEQRERANRTHLLSVLFPLERTVAGQPPVGPCGSRPGQGGRGQRLPLQSDLPLAEPGTWLTSL